MIKLYLQQVLYIGIILLLLGCQTLPPVVSPNKDELLYLDSSAQVYVMLKPKSLQKLFAYMVDHGDWTWPISPKLLNYTNQIQLNMTSRGWYCRVTPSVSQPILEKWLKRYTQQDNDIYYYRDIALRWVNTQILDVSNDKTFAFKQDIYVLTDVHQAVYQADFAWYIPHFSVIQSDWQYMGIDKLLFLVKKNGQFYDNTLIIYPQSSQYLPQIMVGLKLAMTMLAQKDSRINMWNKTWDIEEQGQVIQLQLNQFSLEEQASLLALLKQYLF